MSTDDTPPHQFATFDQAWAATQQQLDRLLKTHADMLEEAAAPKEIDIAGLCAWITDELQPEHTAELLTAAVHRLLGLKALCEQIRTQARLGQISVDPAAVLTRIAEQIEEATGFAALDQPEKT